MESAVIMKILSMQSNFTVSENEISQFVIKNQDFVISNTISSLAKKIGTSDASINRFCKKVGYKGFNTFKIALAQAKFQNELTQTAVTEGNIIESMSSDYRQLVMNTVPLLNISDLEQCANLIKNSRHIHIVSLISNAFSAREFAFRLERLGFVARAHTSILDMHLSIPNLNKDDLVIAMVPSILSKDIYPFLTNAKEKHTKIVMMSNSDPAKFNAVIDVKILIPDKNTANNSLAISNSLIFLFVMDIIFEILLRENKALRKKTLNSDSIISNHQMINSYYYDY